MLQLPIHELGLPSDKITRDNLNKTLKDQFDNGFAIKFTNTDIVIEADIKRVSLEDASMNPFANLGCRFRRSLTIDECSCLLIECPPPSAPFEPALPYTRSKNRLQAQNPEFSTCISELLRKATEKGATDIHIKVGCRTSFRINGSLVDVGTEQISVDAAHGMALDLMTAEQANRLDLEGDVELTHSIDNEARFRVNIFRQQGFTSIAIRCIPGNVPTLGELKLPPVVAKLAEKPHGLVLVTGVTGSGKSTTLAAMINHINMTRDCNIITMEDPIEYVHHDIKAHVNQREIGTDVVDFATALKRGLRQDPDVIMVGEMRDLETIALALTASETGHLVFATLHTTSAAQTPSRIIDVFPSTHHAQIRVQLADSLQGIISQLLLPSNNGGLVVAQEILVANNGIRALIRENKCSQINNLLQTGSKDCMQTLESSLNRLIADNQISYELAKSKAYNPNQIQKMSG